MIQKESLSYWHNPPARGDLCYITTFGDIELLIELLDKMREPKTFAPVNLFYEKSDACLLHTNIDSINFSFL